MPHEKLISLLNYSPNRVQLRSKTYYFGLILKRVRNKGVAVSRASTEECNIYGQISDIFVWGSIDSAKL